MMSFELLRTHYPDHIPAAFKVHVIKEYLQSLLLNRISKSGFAKELVFIGGTSLRFCHGLDRFSEDLDYDYFGEDRELLREQFDAIAGHVSNEGLPCTVVHDYRDSDNYCKMQFPGISKSYDLDDPRKKILDFDALCAR
jgi:predicted nucleotidyltransferase component of viral defense system